LPSLAKGEIENGRFNLRAAEVYVVVDLFFDPAPFDTVLSKTQSLEFSLPSIPPFELHSTALQRLCCLLYARARPSSVSRVPMSFLCIYVDFLCIGDQDWLQIIWLAEDTQKQFGSRFKRLARKGRKLSKDR